MSLCVGGQKCKINNILAEKSWLLKSVRQAKTTLEVSRMFADLDGKSNLALLQLFDDLSAAQKSTKPSAEMHTALQACTLKQVSRVNDVVSYLGLQEGNNILACYTAQQVQDELVATF